MNYMDIVAYCRVSTEKDDQLNSLAVQKEFFEEYARINNHNLVRIYSDEGISGTKLKRRKEFNQLIKDASSNTFKKVVVKDISRFSRNTVDLLNSTRYLKKLGIETLFITSNMTTLGESEFVLTLYGALAQEESANTSKRIKFSKKINAEKGRVPNFVYGYDKISGDYFNLYINEEEAKIVRRIFDMYINQGLGQQRIAAELNREGVKTKRGNSWTQVSISHIIRNQIYIGRVINGISEIKDFLTGERVQKDEADWLVIEKPELQIVDTDVFYRAQEIVDAHYNDLKYIHERKSSTHLFSTLIKCQCCGYSYRRIKKTYVNTYIYWTCSTRNSLGVNACSNKVVIREDMLINHLIDYFKTLIKDEKEFTDGLVKKVDSIYSSNDKNTTDKCTLKSRLDKAIKDKKKVMSAFRNDSISESDMKVEMKEINAEITRMELELKRIDSSLSIGGSVKKRAKETFDKIRALVDSGELTNAKLKEIIEITVDDKETVNVNLRIYNDLGVENTVHVYNNRTYSGCKPERYLITAMHINLTKIKISAGQYI